METDSKCRVLAWLTEASLRGKEVGLLGREWGIGFVSFSIMRHKKKWVEWIDHHCLKFNGYNAVFILLKAVLKLVNKATSTEHTIPFRFPPIFPW